MGIEQLPTKIASAETCAMRLINARRCLSSYPERLEQARHSVTQVQTQQPHRYDVEHRDIRVAKALDHHLINIVLPKRIMEVHKVGICYSESKMHAGDRL